MVDKMDNYSTEQMDSLLTRNWFVDEESILDLLDQANDDTLNFVKENSYTYSDRVRYIVAPFNCSSKLKMKCRSMTDAEIEKVMDDWSKQNEIELEKLWQEHKHTIGYRPQEEVDDMLDDAWDLMQHAMNAVKNYRPGKYVPPSQRTTKDPKLEKLEKELEKRENEFKQIQELVKQADNGWLQDKRDEFCRNALF